LAMAGSALGRAISAGGGGAAALAARRFARQESSSISAQMTSAAPVTHQIHCFFIARSRFG
jgi:hypothetical protein